MNRRTELDVFKNDEFLKLIKGDVQGPVWRVFTRFLIGNGAIDDIDSNLVPSEEPPVLIENSEFNDARIPDNQESTAEAETYVCFENEDIHVESLNNESEFNYEKENPEIDMYEESFVSDVNKNIIKNILCIEYDNLYDEIYENECWQNTMVTKGNNFKTSKSHILDFNSTCDTENFVKSSLIDNTEKHTPLLAILPVLHNDQLIERKKNNAKLEKGEKIYIDEHESEADRKLLKILRTIQLDDVDINENKMLLKNFNAKYSRKETLKKPFVCKSEKGDLIINENNKNSKNIAEKQTEMANYVEKSDPAELQTNNDNIKANDRCKNTLEKGHGSILTNSILLENKSNKEKSEKTINITNTNGGSNEHSNMIRIIDAEENDPAINVGCFCGYFNLFSWFN